MLLLVTALASTGVAPSFDTFLTHSVGQWRGAAYCWQRAAASDGDESFVPLGVAPGHITVATPSSTTVTEIMRSCGGAVQGVEEVRKCQPADGTVALNRQIDGTTFFSYGSWASAPVLLTDAEESDLLTSPACFGLSVCLAHADGTRRRCLVVVSELSTVLCCDVAVEGRDARDGGERDGESDEDGLPDVARSLLERRLQVIVEASAWEGGASVLRLEGAPAGPPGADWLNARLKWQLHEDSIEGGAPLVPPADEAGVDVAYLPGGCWVKIARQPAGGAHIEVGSLCVEAGEVKTVTHEFEPAEASGKKDGSSFRLSKVVFGKVEAR